MSSRHLLLDSPALGRNVHLWCFGDVGQPLIVFPSAAGVAHEWQKGGMIDALAPLMQQGRIKIYCPESNVSRTFTAEGPIDERMRLHAQYERFVLDTLVPFVRSDSNLPHARMVAAGCSMGAAYSAIFALKHPETFKQALCLSGRYRMSSVADGQSCEALYFNDPLAFVPNLNGQALERVRRQTHLTLVVGTGPFEEGCIPETVEMGTWLKRKGIPSHLALWGNDVSHTYPWWQRQARHYLSQIF